MTSGAKYTNLGFKNSQQSSVGCFPGNTSTNDSIEGKSALEWVPPEWRRVSFSDDL